MSAKVCACEEPKLEQKLPEGFKGKVICAECKGISEYPRKDAEYTGTDAVEGFLFYANRNNSSMTYEKCVLLMLLRIEKALLQLIEPKESKKAK